MRISDWSSDVCSSDLHKLGIDVCRKSSCQHTGARHHHRCTDTWIGHAQQRLQAAAGATTAHATVEEQRLDRRGFRSEEHTSELQSLMRISYAVFCLKKKITKFTSPIVF